MFLILVLRERTVMLPAGYVYVWACVSSCACMRLGMNQCMHVFAGVCACLMCVCAWVCELRGSYSIGVLLAYLTRWCRLVAVVWDDGAATFADWGYRSRQIWWRGQLCPATSPSADKTSHTYTPSSNTRNCQGQNRTLDISKTVWLQILQRWCQEYAPGVQ